MSRSLVFFILKLLGVKKIFSHDPIDFMKLRKTDVKAAPVRLFKKFNVYTLGLHDSSITVVSPKVSPKKEGLVLFVPGGAFISGPVQHHWEAIAKMVRQTGKTVWMVDYPKAPEADIHRISVNMDHVFEEATQAYSADQIQLIGDSAGAALIMSLIQRLVQKNGAIPAKLLLITPVFDSSLSNPKVDEIDAKDPMLSKVGALSAKQMCVQETSLKNPAISPLYGDFSGFPSTVLFLGGYDINYPDGLLGVEKIQAAQVDLTLIDEPLMPHIFPLLPLMPAAKKAFDLVIKELKVPS